MIKRKKKTFIVSKLSIDYIEESTFMLGVGRDKDLIRVGRENKHANSPRAYPFLNVRGLNMILVEGSTRIFKHDVAIISDQGGIFHRLAPFVRRKSEEEV